MIQKIVENPRLTLKDLTCKLKNHFSFTNLSLECVGKDLDALIYTLKKVRFIPETANNGINKEKRRV